MMMIIEPLLLLLLSLAFIYGIVPTYPTQNDAISLVDVPALGPPTNTRDRCID